VSWQIPFDRQKSPGTQHPVGFESLHGMSELLTLKTVPSRVRKHVVIVASCLFHGKEVEDFQGGGVNLGKESSTALRAGDGIKRNTERKLDFAGTYRYRPGHRAAAT
jgi:hypothetical protein